MNSTASKVKSIPFEEIAFLPSPGNSYPDDFKFSPNDNYLTFLFSESQSLTKSLWCLNLETKEKILLFGSSNGSEENLSPTERLRRERQRQMSLGVTFYIWADKINRLIFLNSDGIYGIDCDTNFQAKKIVDITNKEIIDPQISPDGEWVGYVLNKEVFITSFDGKLTKQITFGAEKDSLTHGVAEYIAQEEMERFHGFWWSPDSKHIAFTEVDEKHIPVFRIIHQAKEELNKSAMDEIVYPFTGKENAYIKLAVVNIESLQTSWMDLGENHDVYLARVNWFNNSILTAQVENREQTEVNVLKFDIITGQQTLVLQETSTIWINLHSMFSPLDTNNKQDSFIWASERSGFRHLYLYNINGNLIRPITEGNFVVEEFLGINKEQGSVFVITTEKHATQRHLYEYSIKENKKRLITSEEGTHKIIINHQSTTFIDTFSSLTVPPTISMHSLADNTNLLSIFINNDPRINKFDLESPEIIDLPLPDQTILHAAIYIPNEEVFGPGPYPTIVNVYGGPHPQLVVNEWALTANLRTQNLVKNGYLVFIIDNRGSGHRGLQFERVLKGQFGKYEVEDQVFGVEWLISQSLADKNRIGITGWSYGGYMTLMCLSKASHIYKAGFAGAPTNDWRDYDTYYTEKYLGTPQKNSAGYEKSSAMNNIQGMKGKLMIAHGLIDENVHFRHTAKLINKLIELKKNYSLILFPNGRHSIRKKEERIYLEEKLFAFFVNSL